MRPVVPICLAFMLTLSAAASAGDATFRSGPAQVHLLELFTSEGCSSCPPAEERLSSLHDNAGLWKSIVPVEFHVDYWDYLGWTDHLASPAYTQRQQSYARQWGSDSVYTPEFVLDGREFRGSDIPAPSASAGLLTVNLDPSRVLTVRYQPAAPGTTWQAHIAPLGIGLQTDIRAGENAGARMRHDFVALALVSLPLNGDTASGKLTLPPKMPGEKAIAIWITRADQSTPIQAAGGFE
jgi:hypothetical protein